MHETEFEVWDRIRYETGIEIIADIGSGLQGVVYALEQDDLVAKITNSSAEAALASVLMAKPNPSLPKIRSVHRLNVNGIDQFLIVRKDVEDVILVMDSADEMQERHYQNVFINLKHPEFISPEIEQSIQFIKLTDPKVISDFKSVLEDAKMFEAETGIEISDLHFKNLGKDCSGRIIIRDFGMNNIRSEDCNILLAALPTIPDRIPEAAFSM